MDLDYPVAWLEDGSAGTAVGKLHLADGHATLEGTAAGEPRSTAFDLAEIEAVEFVSRPSQRLNNGPTVAIGLVGRGWLRIGEVIGFGIAGELARKLSDWHTSGGALGL